MMWERAWRATGRRTVARTRIPPPCFAPVSKRWCNKNVRPLYTRSCWQDGTKNTNAFLAQWSCGFFKNKKLGSSRFRLFDNCQELSLLLLWPNVTVYAAVRVSGLLFLII